jgi:hypothetical protein
LHALIANGCLLPQLINRVDRMGVEILSQVHIKNLVAEANYFGHQSENRVLDLIKLILPLP